MKKYELLLKELEREIESCLDRGTLHFPTEKELCQHYGMSRQTVRKAVALLTERGLLRSRQGSGIFLTGLKPRPTDNQVSVMLASPDEYIFPGIYGALNRSLSGRGFTLRLLENRGDFMRERAHLEDMLKTPPRALLTEGFSALPSPNAPLYDALSAAGTSLLFLFAKSPNIRGQHCLHEDNAGGAAMLVRNLYEHGHRRIRGIFRTDTQQGMERCYGFLCALRDYGLPFGQAETLQLTGRSWDLFFDPREKKTSRQLLERFLSSCTGLVCYNDRLAYEILRIASEMGISVPEELSLVSFDASYLRESGPIIISSLAHKPETLPEAAAERIAALLNHQACSDRDLGWQLQPGNSVRRISSTGLIVNAQWTTG